MLFQLWKASTNHHIEECHCMLLTAVIASWRNPEKVPEHTRRTIRSRRALISQLRARKFHLFSIFNVILQNVVSGHQAGSSGSKLHMQRPSTEIDAIGKRKFYGDHTICQPPFLGVCGKICEP